MLALTRSSAWMSVFRSYTDAEAPSLDITRKPGPCSMWRTHCGCFFLWNVAESSWFLFVTYHYVGYIREQGAGWPVETVMAKTPHPISSVLFGHCAEYNAVLQASRIPWYAAINNREPMVRKIRLSERVLSPCLSRTLPVKGYCWGCGIPLCAVVQRREKTDIVAFLS